MTDPRPRLYVDFEISCEKDVKKYNVYIQSFHPSTEVLCLGFSVEGAPPRLWWPNQPIPPELLDPKYKLVAHNASYDRPMFNRFIRQTQPEDWDDTSMRCRYYGFPAGLDEAALILLGEGKDPRGKRLIEQLCKPQKVRGKNEYYWDRDPEKLHQLGEYCQADVDRTVRIDGILGPLPAIEQRCWEMYERMNERGVRVDLQLANAAVDLFEETDRWSSERLKQISNGDLYSFYQHVPIKNWVNERIEKPMPSVDVDHIKKALEGDYGEIQKDALEVLNLKGAFAKASIKKYLRMVELANDDGRVRATLYSYGARTGRSTSKGLQIHNLERGKEEKYLWAIEAVKNRLRGEYIGWVDWASFLGPAVRGAFIPSEGNAFVVADYSGIEARVFGWIAGDEEDLQRFRQGIDIYKIIAGQIYSKAPEEIDSYERAVGKETRLSGQYGVGWKTHQARLDKWGIKITDAQAKHNIATYRRTNWRAPKLWKELEGAWRSACLGVPAIAGKCRFVKKGDWMVIQLPGGRSLYFNHPTSGDKLSYTRLDRRGKKKDGGEFIVNHIYGGYLAENICQAIAGIKMRDDMLIIEQKGLCDFVFMVHDEGIGEVPLELAEEREKQICEVMEASPWWAPDLPVAVESWTGLRYKKG